MAKQGPIEPKQVEKLISYYEDIALQCEIRRRVAEGSLTELTIKALKELQTYKEKYEAKKSS